MVNQMNPLNETIKSYFGRLNILYSYLTHMRWRIDEYKKNLQKVSKDNMYNYEYCHSGTALIFSDLSEWPDDGWRKQYSSGNIQLEGNEYFSFYDKLIQRESALSLVLGYEALGSFLKEICTIVLANNSELIDSNKFHKFNIVWDERENKDNSDYWNEYLRYTYKGGNYNEYFKFLTTKFIEFKKVAFNNNRKLNLKDWLKVTALVRHTVHSSFEIKAKTFSKLTDNQKKLLCKLYSGEEKDGNYIMSISSIQASNQLKTLAEFGFIIYKSLSIYLNYKWDVKV